MIDATVKKKKMAPCCFKEGLGVHGGGVMMFGQTEVTNEAPVAAYNTNVSP